MQRAAARPAVADCVQKRWAIAAAANCLQRDRATARQELRSQLLTSNF
ncbi:hypothetical protein [Nostoc sp.]